MILVDNVTKSTCKLWSDYSLAELKSFVSSAKLGSVQYRTGDYPHAVISVNQRWKAIQAGAVQADLASIVNKN